MNVVAKLGSIGYGASYIVNVWYIYDMGTHLSYELVNGNQSCLYK